MFNLPGLEKEVQARWEKEQTFKQSLDPSRPQFNLLDGPPTMNGAPGVHHVEARVFKDLVGRLKTMQGYHVPRVAGWDCHGLPVELSVSAKLGLNGRDAVEAYGVEAFNKECRNSVEHHQGVFENLTRRMGYWVDMDNAWRTMDDTYMETLWGALGEMFDSGMLAQDLRVGPWCTSCGTGLSSHEVAQGAGEREDLSVTVGFKVPSLNADLLVWTTTPWTLGENLLVGVDSSSQYFLAQTDKGRVLASEAYFSDKDYTLLETFKGSELDGLVYQPPLGERRADAHRVVNAEFARGDAETGFVHLAPSYGKDDFALARELGLEFSTLLEADGSFNSGPFEGLGADRVNAQDLKDRGVRVYGESLTLHERASCWRCKTPLVELARPSWFLLSTQVREKLLEFEENTKWHPQNNRFKRWLESNVDWALTRERFWGTPLPAWKCEKGHVQMVRSRQELSLRSGQDQSQLDLHRPYVDAVTFACHCGNEMRRVSEVLDTWFDSGSAPLVTGVSTSDLVAEGVDQTRGWFYTLSAVAALLDKPQPFKEVLSLGLVLDAKGEKMSKSKGNVVEPLALFDKYGADSVRWSLLTETSPWNERRFSESSVAASQNFLYQLWACLSMEEDSGETEFGDLEKWMEARLSETTLTVEKALENYETQKAGEAIRTLVLELTGRYLRARRGRYNGATKKTALKVLNSLALMLAPFVPHYAEALYSRLGNTQSVHLQAWPEAEEVDLEVLRRGESLWQSVEAGRSLRTKNKLRLRQPLSKATLRTQDLGEGFTQVLKEQLNVKTVEYAQREQSAKPNWAHLGKRFGKLSQAAGKAVMSANAEVFEFVNQGEVHLLHAGVDYSLVEGSLVELDTKLTKELTHEGDVADLLRKVVDARKLAGFSAKQWVSVSFKEEHESQLAKSATEELAGKYCRLETEGELQV